MTGTRLKTCDKCHLYLGARLPAGAGFVKEHQYCGRRRRRHLLLPREEGGSEEEGQETGGRELAGHPARSQPEGRGMAISPFQTTRRDFRGHLVT